MTDEAKVPDQDFAGLVESYRQAARRTIKAAYVGIGSLAKASKKEEAARSALLARYEAMREREWQPIERDAKDGDRRLLCWEGFPNLAAHVELGWYRAGVGYVNTYGKPFGGDPTHWMPLPASPAQTALSQAKPEER